MLATADDWDDLPSADVTYPQLVNETQIKYKSPAAYEFHKLIRMVKLAKFFERCHGPYPQELTGSFRRGTFLKVARDIDITIADVVPQVTLSPAEVLDRVRRTVDRHYCDVGTTAVRDGRAACMTFTPSRVDVIPAVVLNRPEARLVVRALVHAHRAVHDTDGWEQRTTTEFLNRLGASIRAWLDRLAARVDHALEIAPSARRRVATTRRRPRGPNDAPTWISSRRGDLHHP